MHKLQAFIFTYRGAFVPLALLPAAALGLTRDDRLSFMVGLPLLLAGIFFRLLGIRAIGKRARVHSAGAREVITHGIFGHVRNPLYLGNAVALGGVSALYFSFWGTPLVIGYMLGLYTLIALYEEECLLQQFGETYGKYKERVPRWWVKLHAYPDSTGTETLTPWKEVFTRERFFISGYIVLVLIATSGLTRMPWFGHVPFTWIILLSSIALFLWVARRLQKRRGNWLCFERTSGQGKLPVASVGNQPSRRVI